MQTRHLSLIVVTSLALGCAERAVAPTAEAAGPTLNASVGQVVHRVSVGGPDVCAGTGGAPGCDANFSLIALQSVDGTAWGEWHDQFAHPFGGIHVTVNCLEVVGNQAWVSGVGPAHDWGNEWVARVVDNGTSANDPPDQISFSLPVGAPSARFGTFANCHAKQPYFAFEAPQGQVLVH